MVTLNFNCLYSHSLAKERIVLRKNEIMRYMGQRDTEDNLIMAQTDKLLPVVYDALNLKGVFTIRKIDSINSKTLISDNLTIKSESLMKNLEGCNAIIIFALTAGTEIDRLLSKQAHISPLNELIISAIATEAIECYADIWTEEIRKTFEKSNLYLKPRFSPGYGDFSLKYQQDIISILQTPSRCGICLTDKLILTPSKSITGVVGITEAYTKCVESDCSICEKTDCQFRKFKPDTKQQNFERRNRI